MVDGCISIPWVSELAGSLEVCTVTLFNIDLKIVTGMKGIAFTKSYWPHTVCLNTLYSLAQNTPK